MKVSELRQILENCNPDAEVTFCTGKGFDKFKFEDVYFVEHCQTDNSVSFYSDEPNLGEYDESQGIETRVQQINIFSRGHKLVKTTFHQVGP